MVKRITRLALGRTLLYGCAAVSLSACAVNFPSLSKKTDRPATDTAQSMPDYKGHIVNSGRKGKTPPLPAVGESLPPALRTATAASVPYSPRPDVMPHLPLQKTLPLAPRVITDAKGPPPAMRLAGPPRAEFSPIATTPQLATIAQSNLPVALRLAPITFDTPPPGPDIAPNRAKALALIDPSIAVTGHFKRPLAPYQTLPPRALTAEPIRPNIETFRQALASSYNNSPSLKAERLRVSETDERYVQARAQGRLSAVVNAQAGYNAQRVPVSSFFGPSSLKVETGTPREATLSLRQPLYEGGRIRALKSRAKFDIAAARERLRDTEQSTALTAATSYADLVRDRDIAKIRRDNLRIVTAQERAAVDRFEVGVGTQTDIFQATARVADAEIILAQSEAQLAVSRASYERVMGHAPLTLSAIPPLNMPDTLDDALLIARRNNPRLRALARDFDAANSALDIAEAAGSPTVALTGTASAERDQLTGLARRDDATLTLELRVPIYAGGQNKSRERAAALLKNRLYFETLETERALDAVITTVWADYEAAISSRNDAAIQVEAAERAYDFITQEQLLGQRTLIDVLDTERELVDARARLVIAERNIHSARFDMLSFMGVFDAYHLALPVALYDPAKNLNAISDNPFSWRKPKTILKDWERAAPPTDLPPAPPF